jgi:hypothetical protein
LRRTLLVTFIAVLIVTPIWLVTRSNCASSFADTATSGSSGAAFTFIDPSKLNVSNLDSTRGIQYTYPHVLRPGQPFVDLHSVLQNSARNRALTWNANGRPVTNGRLPLRCEPAENRVHLYRIVVADGERSRDEFTLLVIPSATAIKFQEWLRAERKDLNWIQALPPVYSRLLPGGSNPEPAGCNPRLWPVLRKVHVNYHPGAAYEMRSAIREDGSGHQATYDAGGQLLRHGTGAGSADRAAPRPYNIFRLIAHRNQDVQPFLWAAQLDGNPVNPKPFYLDFDAPLVREGEHLRAYMGVRPTFNPSQREIPPGVCADDRAP